MKDSFKSIKKYYELEEEDEWQKWMKQIPYIPLKDTWQIQVCPPFGGAIIRFRVQSTLNYDTFASVYLDCYDRLGHYGKPYWEVYPVEGDVARCYIEDINSLLENIKKALNEPKS